MRKPGVLKLKNGGFTLLELIVTVAIMTVLTAIAVPIYTEYTYKSKIQVSESNMVSVKQAFVKHFYMSVMARQPEFPPAPADSVLDDEWASSTILYDSSTPVFLFSEGYFPKNGFGNCFKYAILPPTGFDEQGFLLKDPDTGRNITFRP